MTKYDANLVVIGAGSAGLVSAYIAAAVKAKVILIEKDKMGGDCLNTGCVPSKALLSSAKLAAKMKHASKLGLEGVDITSSFKNVMRRVQDVIAEIEPHDSIERYTELGVECIKGDAEIIDKHTVLVGDQRIKTKSIIIASGARPFVPPIEGLSKVSYLTSDDVWALEELPKRLVILGGGPIGCELGQAFAELGSNVTIVEMLPQLMGREDSDVAQFVQAELAASGVSALTEHKAVSVRNNVLQCQTATGEVLDIAFDQLLIAVGRKANTEGLGLEKLGINLTAGGTIATDDYLRTAVKNIYACGDVVGPYQFTHVASHQAWYASVNALFGFVKKFKVDYRVIPWATFTFPEVARVGLSETNAKQQGVAFEVTHYDIADLDRAITEGQAKGFVKVLTAPGKDKILGVTIVASQASSMIAEFVLAMKYKIGLNKLLGTIHLYPSWMEANKFVAGNWKRNHQPAGLLKWVEKLHNWRRK